MFKISIPWRKSYCFFLCLCLAVFTVEAQKKVVFLTQDSLKVTADLYVSDYQLPFILLLHQAESSRGEYIDIAPRLMKLGYNCLAVDLRSGNKANYITNETAERAHKAKLPARFKDTRNDILAAITYIQRYNTKPVVLFGSSYSASMALIIASEMSGVRAVIAFSPGEYLRPELDVKSSISSLKIPVYIASTELEYPYITDMTSELTSPKTIYKPSEGKGVHGSKALWDESPGSKESWFNLSFFFSKLKEI